MMLQFSQLTILFTCILVYHLADSSENRIVGGTNATILQYPHQVALIYSDAFLCGGSIIGRKWILTAAHCTYRNNDASRMNVRVGSSRPDSGGIVHQVVRIFQHQEYNPFTDDYDFCLLELVKLLVYSPSIFPVQLPLQNEIIPVGLKVAVTGWGRLSEIGPLSKTLQVVEVPIASQQRCQQMFRELTERMVCAGFYRGGRDACGGDSGGPMVHGNKLLGIISWGRGCALAKFYGVYARVSSQRQWIRRITYI